MIEAAWDREGEAQGVIFIDELLKQRRRQSELDDLVARLRSFGRSGSLSVPRELNQLTDDIWEIKVGVLRLPFFFTECSFGGSAARVTHGFQKATQHAPRKEIYRADAIRRTDLGL